MKKTTIFLDAVQHGIDPFHASAPFLNPLKRQKIRFSDVFRGIEGGHWHEKGYPCVYLFFYLYLTTGLKLARSRSRKT